MFDIFRFIFNKHRAWEGLRIFRLYPISKIRKKRQQLLEDNPYIDKGSKGYGYATTPRPKYYKPKGERDPNFETNIYHKDNIE